MTICNLCKLESNDLSLFVSRYGKHKDKVKNLCIECNREIARRSRQKSRDKKREVINERKSVPCIDCGIKYPPYVMDFDHIHDNKSFGIGTDMCDHTLENIIQEIGKCEVVCANCHRERTHSRRN